MKIQEEVNYNNMFFYMKLIGIDFQMFNLSSSNFLGNWYCVFEVNK